MPEDLADHLRLLHPGDDVHFAATVGTTKWIDFVNIFEEPGESCDDAGGRNVPHLNPVGEYLMGSRGTHAQSQAQMHRSKSNPSGASYLHAISEYANSPNEPFERI